MLGFLNDLSQGYFKGGALVGGVLAIACGGFLIQYDVKQLRTDVPAVATLLGREVKCSVEYKRAGDSRPTWEPMACEQATALRQSLGEDKVKLTRWSEVSFTYRSADGVLRQASYPESIAPSALEPGGQFP